MLSVSQALRRVLSVVRPLPAQTLKISDCAGLVPARPVRARLDLPPFDNSAVDGFAVRAADTRGASPSRPVALRLVEEIWAGGWPRRRLRAGQASRIATGAPFPAGADAAVMLEDAADDGRTVRVRRPAARGDNFRRRGGDVRRGRALIAAGRPLRPMDLMLAAQGGHGALSVRPRPRVAVLSTGDELLAPGARPARGKIYDGNAEGVAALAAWAGASVTDRRRARDGAAETRRALSACLKNADAVVTIAGVSVGKRDFLRASLRSLGFRENFWRIAMRPGRPLAFFTKGPKLVFCLPGNPVSSFVTFMLFVRPALLRLAGRPAGEPFAEKARLARAERRGPRRQFLRGRLRGGAVGPAGGQDSHQLLALAEADGLYEVPEGKGVLPRGAEVRVLRFAF